MPESRQKLGKDYTGAGVGAEVVGVEPSVVLSGSVAVVVAAAAAAFVANASSDRHNRSWRRVHFVLEMVAGVAERSIGDCKRRGLRSRAAELGVGQPLQSSTQSSPGVVLLEEGQGEGAAGAD
jgi:hypothetical protein